MASLTDREMAELIDRILTRDSRVDPRELNVRVEDGVVYMSGTVDSAAERRAAEEDIESAPAVRIVNTVSLKNYVERSDEELRAAVVQALARDGAANGHAISVLADGGVVLLMGRVGSSAQKNAAEDVAWWTPGVTDVVSRIEVDGIVEPPDEPDY